MRHTVMAIDDVQENLDILEAILSETYDMILASSAEKALSLIEDGAKPDLILLDISMPGMDGFQFIKRLFRDNKQAKTPVIFVTVANDIANEEMGLALGAVDYIKKPYAPKIMRQKIHNHIELKILRDGLSATVEARTREIAATNRAVILGMSLLAETRDKVTGAHLLRTEQLTGIMTEKLRRSQPQLLDEKMAELITRYSPLHDIGKVCVPDAVLSKPGKLTEEEFTAMKSHSTEGGDILRQIVAFLPNERSQLHIAIEIAQNHHEYYDGSGYPNKLAGEEIPLSARIVTIIDVYDALRSVRPYKLALPHETAVNIILNGDGRSKPAHFDPIVRQAFSEVHAELGRAFDENPDPKVE